MNSSLFCRFLRHPWQVGAICASSEVLGRKITENAGIESAPLVVELGPGTGVFTREVLKKRQGLKNGRFLVLELDGKLCGDLRKKFPGLELYHENALRLPALLKERNLAPADVIIAGLPWAIFPENLQLELLESIRESLAPGGYFLTFAYIQGVLLPAGKRFRNQLSASFASVKTSPVIWRNLPPAFIYRCRK